MKLTEKIAYMKGLLDGMQLDSATNEGKAILQMAEVMEEMGVYIDDLQNQVDELTELCDLLDEDLSTIASDIYDDNDDDDDDDDEHHPLSGHFPIGSVLMSDDDDDDDDEYVEQYSVQCPICGKTFSIDEYKLEEGSMTCPFCGEPLEFDYNAIEQESESEDESDMEKQDDPD